MFREVSIVEVREVLRHWLRGAGTREAGRLSGLDRKTAARYIAAGMAAGVQRDAGEAQLTDELVGTVLLSLRAGRPRSESWARLSAERAFLEKSVEAGLTLVKIQVLLRRRGVSVPYRTLHRFCAAEFDYGRRKSTVRVADGEPGQEVQVDYGRMGLVPDLLRQRRRMAWCLIFTAVFSRHMFCWLTFEQTTQSVIEGFEQAWTYFGGVFHVVIPDNLSPVVSKADRLAPKFNLTFLEYAQSRGFVIDPARAGRPTDKPRVENSVKYVRRAGFQGETFLGLEQAREHLIVWGRDEAGMRIHGTTQRRPKEHFELEEWHRLLPAPEQPYEVPILQEVRVARDHHISIAKAIYSVPHPYLGQKVLARADRTLVKVFWRGELIKTHPRKPPGGRSTDPNDYPPEKRAYALRDVNHLRRLAFSHGAAVGVYAANLLEGPLPWTRMRQVYKLLSLVRRYGAEHVEDACRRSLDLDVVDVYRVARMLERALEASNAQTGKAAPGREVQLRFARSHSEFELAQEVNPRA